MIYLCNPTVRCSALRLLRAISRTWRKASSRIKVAIGIWWPKNFPLWASCAKCSYSPSSRRTPTWCFLNRVSLMGAEGSEYRIARLAKDSQECAKTVLTRHAIYHENGSRNISGCARFGRWAIAGEKAGQSRNRR